MTRLGENHRILSAKYFGRPPIQLQLNVAVWHRGSASSRARHGGEPVQRRRALSLRFTVVAS